MADQTEPANPTIDPYNYLRTIRYCDGTITLPQFPCTSATPDPSHNTPVLSKDIPLNQSNNTWARIFLPQKALDNSSNSNKLPLVVYYHGGGFILLSAANRAFHLFCSNMADEVPVIVVSVEYRLAPENRLPTAYDDAVEAMHMIKTTLHDEWLSKNADFSKCYLMGNSAGGNIAYHAGLRLAATIDNDLDQSLKIQGLILHHPFISGIERTRSELRLVNGPILPLSVADLAWELALPVGSDRDHEYSNLTARGGSQHIERWKTLGWRVLVMGVDGDPLIDRQMDLVKMLEEKGVIVECVFGKGGYHAVEIYEPSKSKDLFVVLKNFILSSTSRLTGAIRGNCNLNDVL